MKTFAALSFAVALGLAPTAHAADAGVASVLKAFAAAFNKGDVVAAKALHVAAPTIIDEPTAPFIWSGPGAFDAWLAALAKTEAAEGKTGGTVALGAPSREVIVGDSAYVIMPSTYTFKQQGKVMREVAQVTMVLLKGKAGWKIESWTWTGPDAKPVK